MVSSAYAVRDRWSTDTWRVMNNIENLCTALERELTASQSGGHARGQGTALEAHTLQDIQTELDRLMIFLAALTGLNAESMTQTIGWLSLDMGRAD